MKVSIITVCLNSKKTIKYTLNSILSQNYENIEHILVDGGSTDGTKDILKKYQFKNKKVFFFKKKSLYSSINFGIKKAKGDLISILHSDDIYNNNFVIKKVVNTALSSNKKIFFGNVVYFKKTNFSKVTRYYSSLNISKRSFAYGNMPPHTGSFYRREIFNRYGPYNSEFKIAGDFEHLFRLIYICNLKFKNLNFITTRMRAGGLSGRNINSFITINREILKTFQIYKKRTNLFKILLRVPPKISQYLFLNQKRLNQNFKYTVDKFYKDEFYDKINVIQNIQKLNFNKNFILSALNLAFVGSLSRGEIKLNKNLINWPDGIFSKIYQKKLKKIPGREVIKKLNIGKHINRIIVFGNLSNNSKKYLISKFKIKIIHKNLPFGTIRQITKKINYKIKQKDLIFLTLPTPKQEQVAEFLQSKNQKYKIICIGGSIGIVSGDEKEVPKKLFYLEFLWRLRYETLRRLKRLIITFYQYITDALFFRKTNKIKINFIN